MTATDLENLLYLLALGAFTALLIQAWDKWLRRLK